ncbi:protein chibby homolog 2 [Ctenodactylus gundi]
MSPLECSECFGDQLLHRTYTWHLTLHSRPSFIRKRDTRFESLEIPINVLLPQGGAEPCPRPHNACSTPRCSRQAPAPRPGRRGVSQPSYPLNRFSSAPLAPLERPTSQADLELDYNPPRVQLSDEMFVFQDGRWVNESWRPQSPALSPAASFHRKLHPRRLARESPLQEENRGLRDEIRGLSDENRALRDEIRGLSDENRGLRDENRALRRENELLQAFREERPDSASPGAAPDAAAPRQLLRDESRALQRLLEPGPPFWAAAEAGRVAGEDAEPPGAALRPEQGPAPPSPFREPPADAEADGGALRAVRELAGGLAAPAGDEDGPAGPGAAPPAPPLLREMSQALRALREENRLLREENRALRVLRAEPRAQDSQALWENSKLRLQQRLVIDTVTEVTARMEMLIAELCAFVPAKSGDPKKPGRV